MKRSQNVRVSELNPHLMCALCGGYYVDATTIIECLHSFCKTCIVRYLDSSKFCPICDVQVHKTKPLLNIRPDHTLQELVYKLVPGLFTREVLKRREFYRKNPGSLSSSGSEAGYSPDGANDPLNTRGHVVPDDTMSISLEFSVDGKVVQSRKSKAKGRNNAKDSPILQKRYLLCPASFTIGHMKKFIRWKFDLSPMLEIDVFHVDEPLSDSYALLDITHIYNWTKNEPFPLYFSVFENAAKRQKCDEQIANLPKESTSEPVVEESSTSDAKQTKRKSSTNDVDDDAESDAGTPAATTKSVKRKLDDELAAVDDKSQVASGSPPEVAAVVGEEMYDGPTENEEEEAEEEEEFYSELPDGQSNGCKISTSSSGKSIVVSIPKHLLENSGSDKEKKKKKSKRRDNHRHHRHHRKHKHQSRDESEADGEKDSVKSKKRKQSRDGSVTAQENSSSVSNSPPTDVNNDVSSDGTTPDSGAASHEVRSKDNSNGSNDVISEDATKSGSHDPEETSQQSCSRTESNTEESTRKQTDKTNNPQDCEASESGRTANTETAGQNRSGGVSGTNQRDSGSVTNEKVPNAAQREPVLHQLQEEWKRHLAADEQSRTKTETETPSKADGRKSPSAQLTTNAGAHAADEKRPKANAKQARDSPQQKKAQIQRLQFKKASLKQKPDSPNKVQTARQKLQSVTETLQKLKRAKEHQQQAASKPAKEHVGDVSTEQKTRNHEKAASPSPVDVSGKNGEKQQTEAKEKQENKKQNEETSEKATDDASTGESSLKKQRTADPSPEVNSMQVPKHGGQKSDTPTTKPVEASKCNTSTSSSSSSSSSPSSSSSLRFAESTASVSSGTQKTRSSCSQPSLDTNQKDKRTSELKDPKSEKPEHADRCTDSLSAVQPTVSTCQRKSDSLPAAKDSTTTALRRGHVTGRPTGPAPAVRPGRPDTLNVPMPWRSLSSLAKAGRKVQESANNALGRNSPCGSSARMLTQPRSDDKRASNGCSPSSSRLALDRRDTSTSKCFSPFPDSLTPFESPTMPKGIKTYSKKDKLLYKNQSLYSQSPFAYDSSFKTILGNPDDDVVAHRNPASGSTPSSLLGSSSLLTVSRKDRTQTSGVQRQIHGHKVIGQLNMVYETIQKPSYSEVCRKSPKQASPSKPPTPTFGAKVNGEQKTDPELNSGSGSGSDNREQAGSDFEQITSDKNSVEHTDGGQPTKDTADVNSGDAMTSSSTSKEQRTNVTFTRTSQTKAEPSRVGDGQPEADRKSMAAPEVGKKCLEYGRCEASFSASSSHLPTSPPRYSHKCGASSPSEAICLKCSPRPRSTSPHVTSGLQRPFAVPCPRERSQSASLGCPRAAHTACATGAHSPQNNNMGAAASLDQTLGCDQCQSAPVGTSTETHNNFDKMALQEVPLDLHKPRSRPDQ